MALNASEVTLLSRILVHQHSGELTFVSAAIADGDGLAEVTVTVGGCHREPCGITVSVTPATGSAFHREFMGKLTEALEKHTPSRLPARVSARELSADWR